MARCPACHRRLVPASRCPRDGSSAPAVLAEAAPESPPLVPGYQLLGPLGRGGFAWVWEAADASGARVAVKVSHQPDEDARLRLEREAAALVRVGPPHVPALVGQGRLADARPYLLLERLQGHTLAHEIEKAAAPPITERAHALMAAVLESAAATHERGVLHRDLKPENVFLVKDGARLMDFGLSRLQASAAEHAHPERTTTGPGAGTPEYMAPEQIAGGAVDARADVYALGLLLYELLTLRLPFTGDRRELEYAHLSFRPPPPSDFAPVPEAIEAVILRCLAKDPTRRFPDARALQAALAGNWSQVPHDVTAPAIPRAIAAASARPAMVTESERHKMVLVFAQGPRATEVQADLEPFSGQLASAQPGRAVYAFGHRAGHNPGHRALAAAQALLDRGAVERLIIDVGEVKVKPRPGGARLFSAAFNEAARYPSPEDPAGILLTAAAVSLLPALPHQPAGTRPDCFVLAPATASPESTQNAVLSDGAVPLVGRGDLLDRLLAQAQRAVSERRPRVAGVLAEPGLGKSRVAFALAARLREQLPDAAVIELCAREPLGRDNDDNLAELLRLGLDLPAAAPPDGGRALLDERLGEQAREAYASAALLLRWIAPDHPSVLALRAAPGVLRANMARAGLRALGRLAARRPVVVVLDDAHWADDTLLDALEQASASDQALWICALGRPVFAEARPGWGQRAAAVQMEQLGPLDRDSAAVLCRYLLQPASEVPEPVVNRLVERAEGVPVLLRDLVRGLRRQGLVQQQESGRWYVATEVLDRLPDSPLLEWIASRELEQLPPELAAHTRLLALLSPEISLEEITGVLGAMERHLADAFPMDPGVAGQRLTRLGLLVQHRTGTFSFRNPVLRESMARGLTATLAERIHRSALSFYRVAPLPEATRTARLAWHAAQAGERNQAAAAYLALAESARESHRYLDADLLYTRALSQLAGPEPAREPGNYNNRLPDAVAEDQRLRALKGRGIMRYRLGRHAGALEDLAAARELASRGSDRYTLIDVMLEEATALDWLFEWHRSRELAERSRELAVGLEAPALQARVLMAVGRSLNRFSRDQEAVEVMRQASAVAAALGDEGYEVHVSADLLLGFVLSLLGQLDEAAERLESVGRLCEAKGDELHLTAMWGNRMCLWMARNDPARVLEDHERVCAYARRMGSANIERFACVNSGTFLHWRGDYADAEPLARRVIEIDERSFGQAGFPPEGAGLLARILWGRGEEAESRRLVEAARAHQAAARAQGRTDLLLQPHDETMLDMMALVVASADPPAWQALLERAQTTAQPQERIELLEMAGLTARRRGDLAGARAYWQQALTAAAHIPNVLSDRIRQHLAQLG
jgi:eukaryotic-like serine/threonine-protein kinase